ncbi:hypothetical protein [Terricaulis silvestris]|uniref:Uncharacterized protein n=1 Tax=Terricaulis silvestris TaxID=2686094 RepID=A0A6I6ML02_9CAUL|nr:hypothetical protein [Terricaulis silvestris]QGZ96045.1 hypothetical protein DSM104635_02901 [Terricaulis silvestris]
MRKFLVSAAVAVLLGACSPPAQDTAETPAPPPTMIACNALSPNAARQVAVGEEVVAAAAASDLRGGSIAPGAYDLISATRVGSPTGWMGTRAVALDVGEATSGVVTFNWAGAAPGGESDRWTASFTDTPQPHMTFTCGRMGEVEVDFAAQGNGLQLRLPDGANGSLLLTFERRA